MPPDDVVIIVDAHDVLFFPCKRDIVEVRDTRCCVCCGPKTSAGPHSRLATWFRAKVVDARDGGVTTKLANWHMGRLMEPPLCRSTISWARTSSLALTTTRFQTTTVLRTTRHRRRMLHTARLNSVLHSAICCVTQHVAQVSCVLPRLV